jgi:hypothetical protein
MKTVGRPAAHLGQERKVEQQAPPQQEHRQPALPRQELPQEPPQQ